MKDIDISYNTFKEPYLIIKWIDSSIEDYLGVS